MPFGTEQFPVIDLSPQRDTLASDPYAVFAELRAQGPVHLVQLPDGDRTWLVVGYREVLDALKDPTLSKNWLKATGQLGPNVIGTNMLTADPPDHTRLRRLVSREFSARRIEALRPHVEKAAAELLDGLQDAGSAELIEDFAMPLSLGVVTDLLGVPFLDRAAFRDWTNDIIVPSEDPAREDQILEEITAYLDQLIETKRHRPGDDLLSALIRTMDEDHGRLDHDELRATAFLLLLAGHETTLNLIANGVHALLRHPAQLGALRANWTLIDQAVDEVLRWEGSLTYATNRFTTEPYRVGETVIPGGGSRVLIALGSANRDPGQFPDPDRFDIHRPPRAHLAFGHGIHHCLGTPLARLEGAVAIRALLERFPDLALETEQPRWRPSMMARGMETLRVRWSPLTGAGER
ncbi:cytochrome P450 [Kitasatospora sp. NPDC008050]|uniref:cytochrome P450 family protein n=1 Tax=Kitasatospora sp. NPDC008050 TaxID=3364021 RepID=UPI0036EEF967